VLLVVRSMADEQVRRQLLCVVLQFVLDGVELAAHEPVTETALGCVVFGVVAVDGDAVGLGRSPRCMGVSAVSRRAGARKGDTVAAGSGRITTLDLHVARAYDQVPHEVLVLQDCLELT